MVVQRCALPLDFLKANLLSREFGADRRKLLTAADRGALDSGWERLQPDTRQPSDERVRRGSA